MRSLIQRHGGSVFYPGFERGKPAASPADGWTNEESCDTRRLNAYINRGHEVKNDMNSANIPLFLLILARFAKSTRGATAMEYGLLAGFIAVGIVNLLYITRSSLQYPLLSVYSDITNAVQSAV
jgi:Flp pilus assembly pilin Flp